ncbi:unnamed protein product [Soboliphyme baturini]|uniref:Uncharacterized protein n=1 Tax=Soboliphyme baturini TaxID=241478 RepID=A0A183ID18_9BILA|nr:unnamed protein product [Soboliphyme baturini]
MWYGFVRLPYGRSLKTPSTALVRRRYLNILHWPESLPSTAAAAAAFDFFLPNAAASYAFAGDLLRSAQRSSLSAMLHDDK